MPLTEDQLQHYWDVLQSIEQLLVNAGPTLGQHPAYQALRRDFEAIAQQYDYRAHMGYHKEIKRRQAYKQSLEDRIRQLQEEIRALEGT